MLWTHETVYSAFIDRENVENADTQCKRNVVIDAP